MGDIELTTAAAQIKRAKKSEKHHLFVKKYIDNTPWTNIQVMIQKKGAWIVLNEVIFTKTILSESIAVDYSWRPHHYILEKSSLNLAIEPLKQCSV